MQEDKYFAESENPIIKEIWSKKEEAESGASVYGECYETVKEVFGGQHIRFDWRSAFECSTNIKYAKPDGTRVVLIDKDHRKWHYLYIKLAIRVKGKVEICDLPFFLNFFQLNR